MCEICSFLHKNLPLQEKAQKLVEYELRNLPLPLPCPTPEALQIWIWKIRFCDSTTPRKVHKYLFFFPVQNKSIRKRTSTSSWKWKGSFRSTDLERKVSLTKHWSQNIPKQIFSLYKLPGIFIISELTQWRIARFLEILFWDIKYRVIRWLTWSQGC